MTHKTVIFTSFDNPNPNALDYDDAKVNKWHFVYRKATDLKDKQKLFMGICSSRDLSLVVKITFYGFIDEVIKRSLAEHRKTLSIFERHPFSQLPSKERTVAIDKIKRRRFKDYGRNFITKNIRLSSIEHVQRAQRLEQQPVGLLDSGALRGKERIRRAAQRAKTNGSP